MAASGPSPATPLGGDADDDAESDLGLFAPAFPGIGLDTHSTECDPFGSDSEVCF